MPRTIAIGDVHGCAKALRALIEAIQPQAEDLIVMLGDYVDRGPESRGVLDLLIDLRSRCRLVPILGNHDQMMLDALNGGPPFDWFECGGLQAIDSYGPGRDLALVPPRPAPVGQAGDPRPLVAEVGRDSRPRPPGLHRHVLLRRWLADGA